MTEKQRLKEYQRELKKRQEAFDDLEKDSKHYVSLINDMNDTFGNWGLDLTSLSENMGKDYPMATTLINQTKDTQEETSDELKLWQLIRKFIPVEPLKVRMHFLDYDINFRQLVYWGNTFLDMEGIDLLYAVYLLLEQQLQKTPNELKGHFDSEEMKLLLPKMTATFENDGFTCIDFSIHGVGNLNVLAKRK